MFGSLKSDVCSVLFCSKHVINIIFLLILACSVSASQNYTSPVNQLHHKSSEQPATKNWFFSHLSKVASLAGRCFNSNLSGGSEYSKSKDNSIRNKTEQT
jgi:hypothetical protein